MVFFRRKKKDEEADSKAETEASESSVSTEFKPQPDKARKWFEYGKNAADTSNLDYALTCYANGIKLDPESFTAHEAMLDLAARYLSQGGKGASGKELKSISDDTPVGKFAAAVFAWMKDLRNPSQALKALDAAIKAEQVEWGNWIAPRILKIVRSQKKLSKSTLSQLMELCKKVGAWDEAIAIGETLLNLDPKNNALAAELKDLSAQRAMDQGGYEQAAGQEGGYRKFIKDADKQRELIEAESISAGESVEERNLNRIKAAYEEDPTVPDVINQYGNILRKRGTDESLKEAYDVYMKGFKETGEYRFRLLAGDIKIDTFKRKLRALREKMDAAPDDDTLKSEAKALREKLLHLQSQEYRERVEKYPTDRFRKFELGMVEIELGNIESAMAQFQSAKDEPKLRVRAGHALGKCFAKEGWHVEAIAEYKEALNKIDAGDKERELEIRYDLMLSLIQHARAEESIEVAKEALHICSGIARTKITYRDIRGKRKEIDDLIKSLAPAGSSD